MESTTRETSLFRPTPPFQLDAAKWYHLPKWSLRKTYTFHFLAAKVLYEPLICTVHTTLDANDHIIIQCHLHHIYSRNFQIPTILHQFSYLVHSTLYISNIYSISRTDGWHQSLSVSLSRLAQCWASVEDAGPTLSQPRIKWTQSARDCRHSILCIQRKMGTKPPRLTLVLTDRQVRVWPFNMTWWPLAWLVQFPCYGLTGGIFPTTPTSSSVQRSRFL